MSMLIDVTVDQISASASRGTARDHQVIMDRPEPKGGQNRGAMGGEFFLMSLGGCFMSNLLAAIAARETEVSNVRLNIAGTLESTPPHFSAVEMTISADNSNREEMEKLVTIAERSCIVANTMKKSVALNIRIQ